MSGDRLLAVAVDGLCLLKQAVVEDPRHVDIDVVLDRLQNVHVSAN